MDSEDSCFEITEQRFDSGDSVRGCTGEVLPGKCVVCGIGRNQYLI